MINITEIIEYIADLVGVSIGKLPEGNGTVMQIAPSGEGETYLDGSSSDNMSLLFLCKNESQTVCISTLENICNTLIRTRHTHGIYNVRVSTQPNYVDKEGGWIYSCVVDIKYYNEEEF